MRSLLMLLVPVTLVTAACSAEPSGEPTPSSAPTTASPSAEAAAPETFDIAGEMVMEGEMVIGRGSDHEAGGMCMHLNGGASFSDDEQLLVRDGGGNVVGIGTLGDFTYVEGEDSRRCSRTFEIREVPAGDFFQLKLGEVESDIVPQSDLEGDALVWTFG